MDHHLSIKILPLLMLSVCLMTQLACSDQVDSSDSKQCMPNEIYNPINGLCVPATSNTATENSGQATNNGTSPSNNATENNENNVEPDCDPSTSECQNHNSANHSSNNDENNTQNNSDSPATNNESHGIWIPQDPATATYRGCTPDDIVGLEAPSVVVNQAMNYQLVLEQPHASGSILSSSGVSIGHAFEVPTQLYTGFIVSLEPHQDEIFPSMISDNLVAQVQQTPGYETAIRRASGRHVTTHDGFSSIVGTAMELPAGIAPHQARDEILAALLNQDITTIGHDLSTEFDADSDGPTAMVYQIISRSSQQYILVASFVRQSVYENPSLHTGISIDDLTQGASVALANETLIDDCISFTTGDPAQVDIIISQDASGSMSSVRDRLSTFAQEFTQLLNQANLDWRIGVTGTDCTFMRNDSGLSASYKALWPSTSMWDDTSDCNRSLPLAMDFGNNGKLLGGGFTRDFQQIQNRLSNVSSDASEYTLTMGVAAIDRSLPRDAQSVNKFRRDAAVILVVITDEIDQYFYDSLSFMRGRTLSLEPEQQDELEALAQPWIDFLLRSDIEATVFGLYGLPQEDCPEAAEISHGIHHIITRTGGQGGSICQPDITNTMRDIASAAAGIASGLRLAGTPVPSTIQVRGDATHIPRDRMNGFDYDGIVNRIAFQGNSAPGYGVRIVIPYLRWRQSINTCSVSEDCPGEQKFKCINGECR